MEVELITKEDLNNFRIQLIEDLKRLFTLTEKPSELMKSKAVRKALSISAGTLHNYRIRKILHAERLPNSRAWYYSTAEVNKLKESLLQGK